MSKDTLAATELTAAVEHHQYHIDQIEAALQDVYPTWNDHEFPGDWLTKVTATIRQLTPTQERDDLKELREAVVEAEAAKYCQGHTYGRFPNERDESCSEDCLMAFALEQIEADRRRIVAELT